VAADRSPATDLARYYDLDLEGHSDDVEFYLSLAADGGRSILELAAGSGRIAIPLAQSGNQVVAVDNDPAMLERARTRWAATSGPVGGSLELVEQDLTALALGRRFDMVILGFNTLPMLTGRDAQRTALTVAAAHLKPVHGRALIDVWLPSPDELAAYDGTLELAWQRTDGQTGDEVAKLWAADYDASTRVATVTSFFDSWPSGGGPLRRMVRRDEVHLVDAIELRAMAESAGLAVESMGGDYSMSKFGPDSDRVVLVCSLL